MRIEQKLEDMDLKSVKKFEVKELRKGRVGIGIALVSLLFYRELGEVGFNSFSDFASTFGYYDSKFLFGQIGLFVGKLGLPVISSGYALKKLYNVYEAK